jgi:hypothetical protein
MITKHRKPKHEHHFHIMIPEEKKAMNVKNTGMGIWICKCGKIVHSM